MQSLLLPLLSLSLTVPLLSTSCRSRQLNEDSEAMDRTEGLEYVTGAVRDSLAGKSFPVSASLTSVEAPERRVENQGSALVLSVPFPPAEALREEIAGTTRLQLKDRGEAHITLLRPDELTSDRQRVLALAKEEGVERARFDVVCIGGLQIATSGQPVFFVVVASDDLLRFRKVLAEKLGTRCEPSGRGFCPENFHPHITLGFVKKDLHPVGLEPPQKGQESCLASVVLSEP